MKNILIILISFLGLSQLQAQIKDTFPEMNPEFFEKKFRIGVTFQQTWTRIFGTVPSEFNSGIKEGYFAKPSIGGGFEMNYFFSKNVGIGVGLSFQQRGVGIYTTDNVSIQEANGDADSTHRHRLRMNCIDMPIKIEFRANKGITKGNRWSGSVGIIPMYIPKTGSIFHSVEDGFHIMENWSKDFAKFDLAACFSFGLDFNAAEGALFKLQVYSSFGFLNPYTNQTRFGSARGYNFLAGIKLAALLSKE